MINFKAFLEKFDSISAIALFRYERTGYPTFWKRFNVDLEGVTPETLDDVLKGYAEQGIPLYQWEMYEKAQAVEDDDATLEVEWDMQYDDSEPLPPSYTPYEEQEMRVKEVLGEAGHHKHEGVQYVGQSKTYIIPTDPNSVNEMKAVKDEIQHDGRADGGTWKVFVQDDESNWVVTHLDFTTSQFTTMVQSVKTHWQKSTQAEKITVEKVRGGDLLADYITEYNAL